MATKKKAAGKGRKAAEKRFAEDLIARGEAVEKKSKDQKLPPGATHWIVEDKETKARVVKRGRFSLL
jgi:hypothetical protein